MSHLGGCMILMSKSLLRLVKYLPNTYECLGVRLLASFLNGVNKEGRILNLYFKIKLHALIIKYHI
jgi:hypothetical protein